MVLTELTGFQEGQFFQNVARVHDMLKDAGLLTPDDRKRIDSTLRLFMATMERQAAITYQPWGFDLHDKFLYKFYVQTSIAKNMVVVDRKSEKATAGDRLLFHSGEMMQAAGVASIARWSYPSCGGMVHDYIPATGFEEKSRRENRDVKIPDDPPGYGEMTGFTEPIRQRRLMLVMDDNILLSDDLEGSRPHDFENLFQVKGLFGLDAPEKIYLGHTDSRKSPSATYPSNHRSISSRVNTAWCCEVGPPPTTPRNKARRLSSMFHPPFPHPAHACALTVPHKFTGKTGIGFVRGSRWPNSVKQGKRFPPNIPISSSP